jgi:hypothetical protein
MKEKTMADEFRLPDEAVNRLETALERIARIASGSRASCVEAADTSSNADSQLLEVAKQLDILINRLTRVCGP